MRSGILGVMRSGKFNSYCGPEVAGVNPGGSQNFSISNSIVFYLSEPLNWSEPGLNYEHN